MLKLIGKRLSKESIQTLHKILELPQVRIGIPEFQIIDLAKEEIDSPEIEGTFIFIGKTGELPIYKDISEKATVYKIPEVREFMAEASKKKEVWELLLKIAGSQRQILKSDLLDLSLEDLYRFKERLKLQSNHLLIELSDRILLVYPDRCPGKDTNEFTIDELISIIEILLLLNAKKIAIIGDNMRNNAGTTNPDG